MEQLDEEDLVSLLKEIKNKYGNISIKSLKQAHIDNPSKYPSYKTFERKLGGVKNIPK